MHTALALFPWAFLGAALFQRENPFPLGLMVLWMLVAAGVARSLHRRPRRTIVHAAVHGLVAGGLFLAWLAHQRGIPPGWQAVFWWRWLGQASYPGQGATEFFWLLWWAALWRRGVSTALHAPVGQEQAATEFALGLGSWALALTLAPSAGVAMLPLLPFLFLYFFIGLAWQSRRAPVSGVGLALLIGGAGFVALRLLLPSSGGFRAGVDAAAGFLGPWIAAFLRWFFSRSGPATEPAAPPPSPGEEAMPPANPLPVEVPWWLQGMVWGLIGLAALAAAAGLALALRHLWRYLMGRQGASRPSPDGGGPGLVRTVWRLLRHLVVRAAWIARRIARWGLQAVHAVVETAHPRSVPALYRGLLRWGWLAGCPRQPWETPLEYASRLGGMYPGQAAAIEGITGAYVRFAYGLPDPGSGGLPDGFAALRRAYRRGFQPGFLLRGLAAWTRRAARGGGATPGAPVPPGFPAEPS